MEDAGRGARLDVSVFVESVSTATVFFLLTPAGLCVVVEGAMALGIKISNRVGTESVRCADVVYCLLFVVLRLTCCC